MDWEIMKEIAKFHNEGNTKECADVIVANLQDMTENDTDFVLTCMELTRENVILCQEQYKKIYSHFDKKDVPDMRCAIRLVLLGELIDDLCGDNEKE